MIILKAQRDLKFKQSERVQSGNYYQSERGCGCCLPIHPSTDFGQTLPNSALPIGRMLLVIDMTVLVVCYCITYLQPTGTHSRSLSSVVQAQGIGRAHV